MEKIVEYAKECLNCKFAPCSKKCPLGNKINIFIKMVKNGKTEDAFYFLTENSLLPFVCSSVCSSTLCRKGCVKKPNVKINEIENYIACEGLKNNWKLAKNNKFKKYKVAVVGGGPSGLSCAGFLAKNGVCVTLFEKHSELGGLLRYGIPDFRLDKKLLDAEIERIVDLGINLKLNTELGKDFTLSELVKEYDAVYLSIGANVSVKSGEGSELSNVFGANEILEYQPDFDCKDKIVVVYGGGNVAIDIARVAIKNKAKKVTIIYRRSQNEMPADSEEILKAKNDGVEFLFQTKIKRIIGENSIQKIECIKTELVKKENEERLYPVDILGSEFEQNVDVLFFAIGSVADKKLIDSLNILTDKKGKILVDENYKTSLEKVYAGGDIISGENTVAYASNVGKKVAENIMSEFSKKIANAKI